MPFSRFLIVGPNDSTIFECTNAKSGEDSAQLMGQFILYSSLDVVEEAVWQKAEYFLPKVDRPFGEKYFISAYVGLAPIKLLVMQDVEPKESVRLFFSEAYELCVKYLLNPFFDPSKRVESPHFREDIVALYNKYL